MTTKYAFAFECEIDLLNKWIEAAREFSSGKRGLLDFARLTMHTDNELHTMKSDDPSRESKSPLSIAMNEVIGVAESAAKVAGYADASASEARAYIEKVLANYTGGHVMYFPLLDKMAFGLLGASMERGIIDSKCAAEVRDNIGYTIKSRRITLGLT